MGVRRLIADGKSRTALEGANQYHKAQHTIASSCLLLNG